MKRRPYATDENGSILVIALIMLALLTTLGIMSTNTTTIDLQIAQNERISIDQFNRAEAAAMYAVQLVSDMTATQIQNNYGEPGYEWLHDGRENRSGVDPWHISGVTDALIISGHALAHFRNPDNWDWTTVGSENAAPLPGYDNTYYAVVAVELPGQSIGVGTPVENIIIYSCFGLYSEDSGPYRGKALIEAGYR